MGLLDGNLLLLTLVADYLSNQVVNTFTYQYVGQGLDEETAYPTLSDIFIQNIVTELQTMQSGYLSYQKIRIQNLSNGIGLYESSMTGNGAVQGDPSPSYVAMNLTYYRTTTLTRNGSKRFAGIPKALVSGNSLLYSGSVLDGLYEQLSMTPNVTSGGNIIGEFHPVIIGRNSETGHFDLTRVNDVRAIGNAKLSTQNTRKQGRGA